MLNQGKLGGFFHSLGFGRRYAKGMGQSRTGPIPVDPEEAARYFRPLPVEQEEYELTESEARKKRQARLLQPLIVRRLQAFGWVARRKVSRLHRTFPIWAVALFYLALAGTACFLLARPLLRPVPVSTEVVTLPPPAKGGLAESIAEITRLISEKDFSRALASAEQLETEYPDDARIFMAKGAVFAGQRAYPEALAAFQKALQLAPSSAAATMNLAEIQFVMGRYAEAESLYRKLFAAQPKNTLLIFRLYLCAHLLKNPEAAAALFRSPAIGMQSLEWYYMQGTEALFAGNKSEGIKTIEQARILFGAKTKPYDKTLARLGLLPETPEN